MSHPLCQYSRMNETNRLTPPKPKTKKGSARGGQGPSEILIVDGFEQFAAASTCQVPHQAIHEFLQGIPHRWSPEDIDRFGYRVGRMALAFQLAIVRGNIGKLRVFPVAFLEWVYSTTGARLPLAASE